MITLHNPNSTIRKVIILTLSGFSTTLIPASLQSSTNFLSFVQNASADDTARLNQQWNDFKNKHGKSYRNTKEENDRYQIFKNNLLKIDQLNADNEKINGQRPFGITQFTDLDPAEFEKIYLNYTPNRDFPIMAAPALTQPVSSAALPTDIDWTTKGATTPIKDQGNCGSCWAFSATEELESALFLSTGSLPNLSAQQVNSCSKSDNGCNGGDTTSAYSYMMGAGVESEASYPYTSGTSGSTGSCQYNSSKVIARMSGWQYGVPHCQASDPSCSGQASLEPSLQQVIVSKGPASVCFNGTPWQYYTSGVLASNCASDQSSMNHCAQLVGYGTSTDGSQYWILRNQWGTKWGMNGFIRIKMGSNVCGVANEVTYVTPVASPVPSPTVTPSPTPTVTPSPSPTVTPSPTPTNSPTPVPAPTVTPNPNPTPTVLPPGAQETADFRSTQFGRYTQCSVWGSQVVCGTRLSTGLVPRSTTNAELQSRLMNKTANLEAAVKAIRPDYYQTLSCALNGAWTTTVTVSSTQKYMIGISICSHQL